MLHLWKSFRTSRNLYKMRLRLWQNCWQFVGPTVKRPHADTLKGSRFANMKELRFDADDGVWRLAYAFDHERKAILLVAGDKSGVSQKRFYRTLIAKADGRFDSHLDYRRKKESK